MIIKEKYIKECVLEGFYMPSHKIYHKYESLINKGNFSFIEELHNNKNKNNFYSIFYSIFFFDNDKLKEYFLNSDLDLFFNPKSSLYLCGLSRNKALFKKIIRQQEFTYPIYQQVFKMINKRLNFEYSELLLEIDVPQHFIDGFFIDCCVVGKAKTVQYLLQNYKLSEDVINQGFKKIIENKKTGTLKTLLKIVKCKINIDSDFVDYLTKIQDYNMIKTICVHKDFDRNKHLVRLFSNLLKKYNKNKDYGEGMNTINLIENLLKSGYSKYFPDSILGDFNQRKYKNIENFLINRSNIDNF